LARVVDLPSWGPGLVTWRVRTGRSRARLGCLGGPPTLDERDQADHRLLRHNLVEVVLGLHRVVEVIDQEGEGDAEEQAGGEGDDRALHRCGFHRVGGHRCRRDELGTPGLQRGIDLELVELLLEQRLLSDECVLLGTVRGIDLSLELGDLELHLLAGREEVVDLLLAPGVDIRGGVSVGHISGLLGDGALRRHVDHVRGARRGNRHGGDAPQLRLHRVAHGLALEYPNFGGDGPGGIDVLAGVRVEQRVADPGLEEDLAGG